MILIPLDNDIIFTNFQRLECYLLSQCLNRSILAANYTGSSRVLSLCCRWTWWENNI